MGSFGLGGLLTGNIDPLELRRRQQATGLKQLGLSQSQFIQAQQPDQSQMIQMPEQNVAIRDIAANLLQPPNQITPQSAPWGAYESSAGPYRGTGTEGLGALGPVPNANVGGMSGLGDAPVQGPMQQQFAELQQQGPERDIDASGQPRHIGFGERLMHGLKAGGLAALTTGNPFAFPIGFGLGTAKPQYYHNLKYHNIDQPLAYQQAHQEAGLQDEQIRRAVEAGNLSGINPYTGQPTEGARERQLRAAQLGEQQRWREMYQGGMLTDRGMGLAQQAKAEHDQRAPGQPYGPEVTTKMPWLTGKTAPPKQWTPYWVQDVSGQWVDVNAPQGPRMSGVQGKVPRDPNDITPYQQYEIDQQNQTKLQARLKDARGDLNKYSELQHKAAVANDLATKVHNLLADQKNYRQDLNAQGKPKSDPYVQLGKNKYTVEDEEELWNAAKDAGDEWKRHGDYMNQTHQGLVKFQGDKAFIDPDVEKQITQRTRGVAPRRSIDDVKATARADVKAHGESPQAIKAFESTFGEKY